MCDTHDLLECNCTNKQVSKIAITIPKFAALYIFYLLGRLCNCYSRHRRTEGICICTHKLYCLCLSAVFEVFCVFTAHNYIQTIAMGELLDWKHYFKPIHEGDLTVSFSMLAGPLNFTAKHVWSPSLSATLYVTLQT